MYASGSPPTRRETSSSITQESISSPKRDQRSPQRTPSACAARCSASTRGEGDPDDAKRIVASLNAPPRVVSARSMFDRDSAKADDDVVEIAVHYPLDPVHRDAGAMIRHAVL